MASSAILGSATMNQRLHFITFATQDLDAARAFYQDGLGWEAKLDVPGEILFYQVAPGLLLGLFEAGKFAQDLGGSAPPEVSGVTLSHNVDSADAVRQTVRSMAAAGGSVLQEPAPSQFGGIFHAHVQDPNGVLWEVAHNPGWRINDDGSVELG